jgi:hypothetical protein
MSARSSLMLLLGIAESANHNHIANLQVNANSRAREGD